jgi:DNA-binding transcriptional ArsR family regulator
VNLDYTLMALADPTRRAILRRLTAGPARVTDVARPFRTSLNTVSKHIRILERAALVRRRIAGREHHLSLNRQPLDQVAAWIEETRAFWTRGGLGGVVPAPGVRVARGGSAGHCRQGVAGRAGAAVGGGSHPVTALPGRTGAVRRSVR